MQMLDRISEVQIAHNRQKTAAMAELLSPRLTDNGTIESGTGMGDCTSTTEYTRTDEL
jgi:hypothetical protein